MLFRSVIEVGVTHALLDVGPVALKHLKHVNIIAPVVTHDYKWDIGQQELVCVKCKGYFTKSSSRRPCER